MLRVQQLAGFTLHPTGDRDTEYGEFTP